MANTDAAIMAVPRELETIRLVGDEEKHATLLYFGETATLPADAKETLIESVKLAASLLYPFSEEIREINRLGDNDPPALVAKLYGRNLSEIRKLFVANPSINAYLTNGNQHPSYTPHVTIAYPDYTQEALLRVLMKSIYAVSFDRLAVWWNDERIGFELGGLKDTTVAHALKALIEASDEDAQQYGVRGMKWGVRRKVDSSTGLVARTASEDQIKVAQIQKKLASGGTSALSNRELKEFTDRIRLEQEFNRATQSIEAQKGQSFVTRYMKNQGQRQFTRVSDKALDVLIEKAPEEAGLKVAKRGGNPDVSDTLVKTAKRLQPKKK